MSELYLKLQRLCEKTKDIKVKYSENWYNITGRNKPEINFKELIKKIK